MENVWTHVNWLQSQPKPLFTASISTRQLKCTSEWSLETTTTQKGTWKIRCLQTRQIQKYKEKKKSTSTETRSTKSSNDFTGLRKQATWGGNTVLKSIWVQSPFLTRMVLPYQTHAVQTGTQFNIPPQKVLPGQVWHSKKFENSTAFVFPSLSTSLFCSIHYTSMTGGCCLGHAVLKLLICLSTTTLSVSPQGRVKLSQ